MITNAYTELTIATRMLSAPTRRAHSPAPATLDTLVMASLAKVRAAAYSMPRFEKTQY